MGDATGTWKMEGCDLQKPTRGLPWTGRKSHLHFPPASAKKDDKKTHGEDRFDAASRNRPFWRGSRVVLVGKSLIRTKIHSARASPSSRGAGCWTHGGLHLIARKGQTAQEPAVNQTGSRDAQTIAETDRQFLWALGRCGCGRRERESLLVLPSSRLSRPRPPRRSRSQRCRGWRPGWSIATAAADIARDASVDWMSSRCTSICSAVSARLASWEHGTWN
ncbi:hypothetical protein B0T18DRAFT_22709 [Schizothecium vesticola]|uniref:Uncharacterized protein n=1 Tax=Schizothecium vesticola TaxID=314040 RepID=A0AA40F9N1_9PEZI|nr:hypothetical protein B0T18DRAFT_22709 [Schizothecium vesticola]